MVRCSLYTVSNRKAIHFINWGITCSLEMTVTAQLLSPGLCSPCTEDKGYLLEGSVWMTGFPCEPDGGFGL